MANNAFFQELENTRPFFKAAFEGFSGTGKSFTAGVIACGLHDMIKSKKPIALYYTERAGKGAMANFYSQRKKKAIIKESRTLADLLTTINLCEQGHADILVIDSISHIWESFVQAYMRQKNRKKLYFQDWGVLKPDWKEKFSDRFLEAQVHIIFTGRAGYEYDFVENSDGEKELAKTGIKMRVEGETEYEPDMVVLMEKVKEMNGNVMSLKRRALVVKDRTNLIDGKSFFNPSFEDFKPAINILLAGSAVADNFDETPDDFESDDTYENRKKQRTILLEEVKGIFDQLELGQSATAKAFKADLAEKVFGSRSWTAIEELDLKLLEKGKTLLDTYKAWFVEYFRGRKSQGLDLNKEDALAALEKIISPPAETPADEWLAEAEKPKAPRASAPKKQAPDELPGFDTEPQSFGDAQEPSFGGAQEPAGAAISNGQTDLF